LDDLRAVPAAVRFLSCEPLLGPLDGIDLAGIGWVIAATGGKSGPGARPMQAGWAEALRGRCPTAGVAFFMKLLCTNSVGLCKASTGQGDTYGRWVLPSRNRLVSGPRRPQAGKWRPYTIERLTGKVGCGDSAPGTVIAEGRTAESSQRWTGDSSGLERPLRPADDLANLQGR
jgi:hypothetical protein